MYIPVKGQYGVTDDKDVGVENKPKSGTCFTWSGNHYKTFDGQVFRCAYLTIYIYVYLYFIYCIILVLILRVLTP